MKITKPERTGRNDAFYNKIMIKVERELKSYENKLFGDYPIGSDDLGV